MIKIKINHQEIQCHEGQSVLEAARSNNIYIPAICYLTGCSPTVACKMCMAEMDGKRIYTCNTKVKENATILTQTPEILSERKAIMQTYGVNHPLECGVCDKSGECELQDLTLKMRVNVQPFNVQDDDKEAKTWAQTLYDPNLCIMCERCVTTCKDNIGDNNLKAIKTDLHAPDKFKDDMPKDPYSVWSRKQKALIGYIGDNPCLDCGECISVCPVGALGYKDFSYTANAWELQKIPSTCQHCPAGCFISYEVRHQDIAGEAKKIYRVSNNFNHNPICGAGRFVFDVSSSTQGSSNITEAINAIKNAKAVRIGGDLTNEEAYLIEGLRQKLGFKLYCEETRLFQEFARILGQKQTYDLTHIKSSDLIITLGCGVKTENPLVRYAINNALKLNKNTSLIYAHPIKDTLITKLSRSVFSIAYAPKADEIMLAMILTALGVNPDNALSSVYASQKTLYQTTTKEVKKTLPQENSQENSQEPKEITEKIEETIEIPYYEIFEQAGLEYAVYEKLTAMLTNATAPILLIGQDIYKHKRAKNIAALLAYLEKTTPIKIILIPPQTNSVGISLLCTLDTDLKTYPDQDIVGIRCKGGYSIDSDKYNAKDGSKENVDFILPALNQLEGTLSNFEYKLLPLKPALPYTGYDLSDIARAFGFYGESLVDYTHLLPQDLGYQNIPYDALNSFYTRSGEDKRGYHITPNQAPLAQSITPIEPITPQDFNAYLKYPQAQFSAITSSSHNLQTQIGIYTSKNNLDTLKLSQGDTITLTKGVREIKGRVYLDYDLEQDIFVISPCLDTQNIFENEIFENLTLKGAL
ncbi:NADH dehydrogenase [Helicobacter sp. 12S02634-8]|uniref:NADH-quinone oxidoreductase subunit G n=1 Tax=Helicobacter sp. 12S02634-8 TaxID=1476199 RepID=UPI000BA5C9E5|nr:NADH-quinone oxidoreductase subunit G [Helicobacter sp. 12S02634-8]PAF47342.1 NADH dehydrogenase [Helicobacter sp. 12S02634-8]